MPTVVYPQPSIAGGLAAGLAGAFQGQVQGQQFNEQRREFNSDLAFRVAALKSQEEQGRLNREQQAALAKMEDQLHRDLTGQQIASEEKQTTQKVASEEKQTTARLAQSNVENKRTTAAENFATQKRYEEAQMEQAAKQAQLFDQQTKLAQVGQTISQYGDPGTWTPETTEAAFQQWRQNTTLPGATPDPAADAAARSEFEKLRLHYPAEVKRASDELQTFTQAKALGEAAGTVAARSGVVGATAFDTKSDFSFADIWKTGTKPGEVAGSPVTGLPPLRKDSPVAKLISEPYGDAEAMIHEASIAATTTSIDQRQSLFDSYKLQLDAKLKESPEFNTLSPATKKLIEDQLESALYHAVGMETSPPTEAPGAAGALPGVGD